MSRLLRYYLKTLFMLNRTISKFAVFVIFAVFVSFKATGCSFLSPDGRAQTAADVRESTFDDPKISGKIESADITESSGLVASKCRKDVFWTHNDSGDDAFIFAINSKGGHLGTWKVSGAGNIDWEDIAAFKDKSGKCFLYIGEIGNNARERGEGAVYRLSEPTVLDADKDSNRKKPRDTEASEMLKFAYPDARHDAEVLLVHPAAGDIYVITKRINGPSAVYKIKPEFGSDRVQTAEKIADIAVPAVPNGLLTGGDISTDGKHIVVCDYFAAYELALPEKASDFDQIWKQKPEKFDIGKREAGEAIAYSPDGNSVIATSEKKHSPVIEARRKPGR